MPASMTHLSNKTSKVMSILAKWPEDSLYYEVLVKESDEKQRRCFVEFEDGLTCWMSAKDLHIELKQPEEGDDEEIVCCVCDGGLSEVPNEIVMCDWCNQGFHIQCHDPVLDRDKVMVDNEDVEWLCQACQDIISAKLTAQTPPATPIELSKPDGASPIKEKKSKKTVTKENDDSKPRKKLTVKLKTKAEKKVLPQVNRQLLEDSSDEEVQTTATSKRKPPTSDSTKLEHMEKELINAALTLADTQENIVGTKEFVEVVASMDGFGDADNLPEIKSVNKVTKNRRTIKTPSAAA